MKKKYIILLSIVAVLIVVRLLLPSIVLKQINKQLEALDEYKGHVKDVDLALYHGAILLDSITLEKAAGTDSVPFLEIENLEVGIDWRALLKGKIVTQSTFTRPKVNFVASEDTTEEQFGGDYLWFEQIIALNPMELNKLEVTDGEIHFKQFDSEPQIDLVASNFDLVATNLRNVVVDDKSLPSSVTISATVLDGGKFTASAQMNLIKEVPDFNANISLEAVPVTSLNNFLVAYTGMDAAAGELNFYSEAAAEDGEIDGYFKPLMKNLEFREKGEDGRLLNQLAEGTTDIISGVLSNPKKDQLASKIPISGNVKNTEVGVWVTLKNLFKNAFIEAFKPHFDDSIMYPIE